MGNVLTVLTVSKMMQVLEIMMHVAAHRGFTPRIPSVSFVLILVKLVMMLLHVLPARWVTILLRANVFGKNIKIKLPGLPTPGKLTFMWLMMAPILHMGLLLLLTAPL